MALSKIDTAAIAADAVEAAQLKSDAIVSGDLPAGSVLQVVQTSLNTTTSFTSTSVTGVNISGLNTTITPSSTSSKILVLVTITRGSSGNNLSHFSLYRGTTQIGSQANGTNRPSNFIMCYPAQGQDPNYSGLTVHGTFLDSPSTTSATTYKINGRVSGGTTYLNRNHTDPDSTSGFRGFSSMTLMEISG